MLDEHVYRHIFSFVTDDWTRASLCCSCPLFQGLVQDISEAGCSTDASSTFGSKLSARGGGQWRAQALLAGHHRRLLLADLQTAYREDIVADGTSCYRFADLDSEARAWAKGTQLAVAGNQCLLLYNDRLELLGVVEFFGRQDAIAAETMFEEVSSVYGQMSVVLANCPLGTGLVVVAPLLREGAADYLGTWQPYRMPGDLPSSPVPWLPYSYELSRLQEAVVDRPGLGAWRLLALHHCGLVTAYVVRGQVPPSNLRCLDITGIEQLDDAQIAEMLAACPNLTTLRAAASRFGPVTLAALSGGVGSGVGEGEGNVPSQNLQHVENGATPSRLPEQQQQQPQQSGQQEQLLSMRGRSLARLREQIPADGRQSGQREETQLRSGSGPVQCAGRLQTLDVSFCSLGESCGSALVGALCQLSSLRGLRVNYVEGAEELFVALQQQQPQWMRAVGGTATNASPQQSMAALPRVLGQLTRLEMLAPDVSDPTPGGTSPGQAGNPASTGREADPVASPSSGPGGSTAGAAAGGAGTAGSPSAGGLGWRHLELLAQHCTALRHLAISSRRLAAQQQQAGPLGQYAAHLLGQAQGGHQPHRGAASCQQGQLLEIAQPAVNQAAQQGTAVQAAGQSRQQPLPRLPSLLHLEVGWGTGGAFLWHSMRSSPYLASLVVHAGAVVNDWHLQQLAASCRYLGRLELTGCNVSDEGLPAILASCRQLTTLQLQSCTGPITDSLALSPPLAPRAPAFRLQHLTLSWSNLQLTDRGLGALLDPSVASLRCLVLRGCSRLSDAGLWPALAQHAATLECLELGDCGSLQTRRKLGAVGDDGSGSGGLGGKHPERTSRVGGTAASGAAASSLVGNQVEVLLSLPGCEGPAPLSAEAAAHALAACQRLQAVTIRGSVVWSGEIEEQIYEQPVITALLMP